MRCSKAPIEVPFLEDAAPLCGEAVTNVTDDQQDVGSACERQDGKRVVRGSKALALR